MGGHKGGSTASKMAVSIMEDFLAEDSSPIAERMGEAIQRANRAIYEESHRQPHLSGMGTTAVIIGIEHATKLAWVAHVGDSRAYLLREHIFVQITRDHTLVQRLVDDGILSPEDAINHPNSNVISRSLGGGPAVEVEHGHNPLPLQPGDTLLICSDGLYDLVGDDEIAEHTDIEDLDSAADIMIKRACEEGGYDNITVTLARVEPHMPAEREFEVIKPALGVCFNLAFEHAQKGLEPPPGLIPDHVRERMALQQASKTNRLTRPGELLAEEPPVAAPTGMSSELRNAIFMLVAMIIVVGVMAVIALYVID